MIHRNNYFIGTAIRLQFHGLFSAQARLCGNQRLCPKSHTLL